MPSLLAYTLLRAGLAETIKGSKLRCTTLAMEREQIVHSSLLTLAGAVLADLEPTALRLARGCIAQAFTAFVHAVASRSC